MFNLTKIIISIVILISFAVGFYFYPSFPDRAASHWNISGEVDGYMQKAWALFLMPAVSLVMFLFFLLLPKIDPLRENIKKFKKYFDRFILLIIIFLFYIYILTILWNIGQRFNMGQLMAPAIGILFFYAGVLVGEAKMNWFVGIRTPWTLSSEKVWDKTHKLGAKLFKISGVIAIFGFLFPAQAFLLILVPAVVSALYSVIYSYFEYRKEKK
jgi:uncharacterized membrane protein